MATINPKQPIQVFQIVDSERNILDTFGTGAGSYGTGVSTALVTNVGTTGAFVVKEGVLGEPASGDLTNCINLPAASITLGAVSVPIILRAKGVTVKTSATPADIVTITVPAGITRWHLISSTTSVALAETASGTLAGASFTAWTAAGGTGTQLTSAFLGAASTSALVSITANSLSTFTSASTIVIRQTISSANAGTMSFYFTLYPLI